MAEMQGIGLINGHNLQVGLIISNKYDFLQHFLNFFPQL
jgi:hypothetical protein